MSKKQFRFGVTSIGAPTAKMWKEKVTRTEELGYSTLLIPDHFIEQIATIPALMSAASLTSSLRVGSIVCSNDFRHPILLAKEAATIDMLSGGRFELGIGAGWLKSEYDAIGIPFDTPGTRVARLEEAVQVIKSYFKGDQVIFEGKYYQINSEKGLESIPVPVQKPHPPILIGGGGKRMLTLAAREADIIGLALRTSALGTGPDPADIATTINQKIEWIKQAAGNRYNDLEIHIQTWAVMITDDRESSAKLLGKQFPLPPEILLNLPYLLIGSADEIIEQIEKYRESYGISYYSIFEQYQEDFAPVVAYLSSK
ncbi:MAG TPA: LLM class F420-dependent oxidoreductase [Anaerolineales bacterium]|jgi:probable F420-dependent oxidoreductase|nr:LLM class F420-dependent oxidoreductase [Anaerolineales bacterium]